MTLQEVEEFLRDENLNLVVEIPRGRSKSIIVSLDNMPGDSEDVDDDDFDVFLERRAMSLTAAIDAVVKAYREEEGDEDLDTDE